MSVAMYYSFSIEGKTSQEGKIHTTINRGDIFMADISGVVGNIQSGVRPCLIVSNSIGNKHSNIVQIAPISSSTTKRKLPTHVNLPLYKTGLTRPSIVLMEQIMTLDQWCLMDRIGKVDEYTMTSINKAIAVSLGLDYCFQN